MAPFSEIASMLYGQAFGKTHAPNIDLKGQTIVITGANTGLGFECAKHLYVHVRHLQGRAGLTCSKLSAQKKTSHIILACRNTAKGQAAADTIVRETNCKTDTRIDVWELDLSNYESVKSFSSRVLQLPRLDAFIANAGMELQSYQTAEDLEIHLTVNVVSCFLSAISLLPKLRETAETHSIHTTLTFCGSMYHIFGPDAEFDKGMPEDVDMFDALSTEDPGKTDIIWRYALSKLMVHQCFHELVGALAKDEQWNNVVVNIINPGWCGTELSRAKPSNVGERVCFAAMGWTAEKGSRMYMHALATGRESHGKYLSECQVKTESRFVRSERGRKIQAKMWKDLMGRIRSISPEVAGIIKE
jgi:retinol dehydrogenase-12